MALSLTHCVASDDYNDCYARFWVGGGRISALTCCAVPSGTVAWMQVYRFFPDNNALVFWLQAQSNEYKYGIERLARELQEMKKKYFEQKRKEQIAMERERALAALQVCVYLCVSVKVCVPILSFFVYAQCEPLKFADSFCDVITDAMLLLKWVMKFC